MQLPQLAEQICGQIEAGLSLKQYESKDTIQVDNVTISITAGRRYVDHSTVAGS